MFRTIKWHEENGLGLPYPIVLVDSAQEEVDEMGQAVGISIPHLEGLVASLAVLRAMHPLQLHGSEVRFIRRAIGMSAKDMAAALEMDPATFSRWENGKQSLGGWAERQVRAFAVILLRDKVAGLSYDPKDVVGLRIQHRRDGEWPHFEMRLISEECDGEADSGGWDTTRLAA